jgi:hypothetical protein
LAGLGIPRTSRQSRTVTDFVTACFPAVSLTRTLVHVVLAVVASGCGGSKKASPTSTVASAPPITTTPTHLPRSRRYPEAVQERFLAACHVGKGSPSRRKCVLAKQELRPVEKRHRPPKH